VPTKGLLILKDNADDGNDRFLWKFRGGPSLAQSDFGDPTGTTGYVFCVYDDGVLVMDVQVPLSNVLWSVVSTKGWQYKDLAGGQDGLTNAKLLGGDAGKSKAHVKGKGGNVPLPAPISAAQFLNATTSVRAQLHGSNGACYETAFTPAEVIKNDGRQFKAKF
jgi:hypothetical protein